MVESQWYLEVNGQKIGPFALDHIQGLYADGEIKGYHQVTSDQLDGQWITVQELVDSLRVAAPPPPTSDFSAPPPPPQEDEDEEENTQVAMPVLETAEEESETSFEQAESPSEMGSPPPPPEEPAEFNTDFQPPPRPPDLLSAAAAAEVAKKLAAASPATIKTLPPEPKDEPSLAPVNDPAISMLSSLQLFKERQEKTTETYDPTLVIQSDMLSRGDRSSSPRMWMVAVIAGVILGCISWGILKTLKNKTKAPPGTMTQISNHSAPPPVAATAPRTPPPVNVTTPPNSAFRPAEGPHEMQHRLAPPRPLVAPTSAPAPVRQFEPPRDQQQQQIDTAQPNEIPPQPQYAPQYQAYPPPNAGNGDPSNPQQQVPQQPYVDPNNPGAPPVYPAGGENFQNGQPPQQVPQQVPQAPPGMPQGGMPPGADGFNAPSVQQVVPQEQQDLMLQQQQLNQQQPPPQQ
jgi:hypothetical protein